MVACQTHILEVAGSNPAPAIKELRMKEKLYVLRNGCVVRIYSNWWIEVVDAPYHLRDIIGLKHGLLLVALEKGFVPIKIGNDFYSLRGGGLGDDFDVIKEYNPYVQEEMEL